MSRPIRLVLQLTALGMIVAGAGGNYALVAMGVALAAVTVAASRAK